MGLAVAPATWCTMMQHRDTLGRAGNRDTLWRARSYDMGGTVRSCSAVARSSKGPVPASELINLRCRDVALGTGRTCVASVRGGKDGAPALPRDGQADPMLGWRAPRRRWALWSRRSGVSGSAVMHRNIWCSSIASRHLGSAQSLQANASRRTCCAEAPRWSCCITVSTRW